MMPGDAVSDSSEAVLRADWSFHRGRQSGIAHVGELVLCARRIGKKSARTYRWTVTAWSSGWFDRARADAQFKVELNGRADSEHAACLAAEAHAERVRVGALALADTDAEMALFQARPSPPLPPASSATGGEAR